MDKVRGRVRLGIELTERLDVLAQGVGVGYRSESLRDAPASDSIPASDSSPAPNVAPKARRQRGPKALMRGGALLLHFTRR